MTVFPPHLRLKSKLVSHGTRLIGLARSVFILAMPWLSLGRAALGQAIPVGSASPISTGFLLPRIAGTMSYSLTANETLTTGYYSGGGTDSASGVSGNLAFISSSPRYPISMVFSAGHSFSTSSQPSTSYLDLALSQVVNTRNWNFILSDLVNYLPGTPSTGLSGVPGAGDLGVAPVGASTGQGVLTGYSTRVSNTANGSAVRHLTGKTSLSFTGNYSLLTFLGNSPNNGLDSTSYGASIGLNHRIDGRNSFGGTYSYANTSYGAAQPAFDSQTASMNYSRQLTRLLSMTVAAGPQWSSSSSNSSASAPAIPTSINAYATFSLSYIGRFTHYSLSYFHGDNNGFGVVEGARSDSASFTASRSFGRVWNTSFTSAYSHTTSLAAVAAGTFSPQTLVDGVQISRALPHSLSAYASYTLEDQTSATGFDLFSGLFQVTSFGLTYAPRSARF